MGNMVLVFVSCFFVSPRPACKFTKVQSYYYHKTYQNTVPMKTDSDQSALIFIRLSIVSIAPPLAPQITLTSMFPISLQYLDPQGVAYFL